VRFAPSPTGNLHVGGARTALFNWLYARNQGGKFILRVEDTDQARSTRASEEAMLRDLAWLGLNYDEGPNLDVTRAPLGPYRQSERTDIYMKYVNQLVDNGVAYPCFCTDEELEAMKVDAEAQGLPPVYRGKWKSATAAEVQEMLDAGNVPVYRFRVPEDEEIVIEDLVRGRVAFNTNTLGDFVIMRSNGLPVYNFCVTIDDATMGISHVLRAEEHLPNTLRQVLIYRALGWPTPQFGHMSIILAPDRSKLSKRHGATSVGQFAEMGYIPEAMNNYLALLGWNDGTEQEIFTNEELREKFSISRITKSAAIFDVEKLKWMNGQMLRALTPEDLESRVGTFLKQNDLLTVDQGAWVARLVEMTQKSLELLSDAGKEVQTLVTYPLEELVASAECKEVLDDNFKEVAEAILAAYDSGELLETMKAGELKKFFNTIGKAQGRKGKRLFMPMRVALTGQMHGTDVGQQMVLLTTEAGEISDQVRQTLVGLPERMDRLRKFVATL